MRKKRFIDRLNRWMGVQEKVNEGRPEIADNVKQVTFNLWIRESIVTVDRRNGRDFVTIPKGEFDIRYSSAIDYNSITGGKVERSKRGLDVVRCLRMISTATVKEIKQLLWDE